MYKLPDATIWNGRNDPESKGNLWHHKVQRMNLRAEISAFSGISILGFESDEGVKRNMGRVGALNGPDAIRKAFASLVVHRESAVFDAGNVVISKDDLAGAQIELAGYTHLLLSKKLFPIILGGGHEVSYGHVKGAYDFFGFDKKVGVINFDPHFDLRSYQNGAHSGSWARQLFDEFDSFQYLPVGINEAVNLPSMFELMRDRSQQFITMDELLGDSTEDLTARLNYFIDQVDHVCLTLDLDVFSASVAPGVSALNAYGAFPQQIKPLISAVGKSGKLRSFDIAEMNPTYDDGRTAKLAAGFVYDVVDLLA